MAADAKEKEKKPKKEKAAAPAAPAAEATAPAPAAAPAPPRPPADPRMKVWKKFQGRFLPKGPLRERLATFQTRWNSGEDRGGITVEELKALLTDWRASREKGPRAKKPSRAKA